MEQIEQIDEIERSAEVISVKYRNIEEYKIWNIKWITPHLIKYLKSQYPDSLILRELNKVDHTIIDNMSDDIIPVEIQKSVLQASGSFNHTLFELYIRKGLEDNIRTSGKCWFFMDSEYLRHLQSDNLHRGISMDMTWLIPLVENNIIRMFTIKHNGEVVELKSKDIEFFKYLMSEDEIELNKNKVKIVVNILRGHNYTQSEIDGFYTKFDNSNAPQAARFFSGSKDDRCKLYGDILQASNNYLSINELLNMTSSVNRSKTYLITMGIFDINGTYKHGNLVTFVDRFDICKYFPGYVRNKDRWEKYIGSNLTPATFELITNGSLKYTKSLMDY